MTTTNKTAKHTPGPWVSKAWQWVESTTGTRIAKTHDARWTSISLDEAAANARLIAAAPDLLAAAKGLDLTCLCDVLNPCSLSKTDKHWGGGEKCGPCKMVAAIARAEGR